MTDAIGAAVSYDTISSQDELARLRLTVAKVREVYDALRAREPILPRADTDAVDKTCRVIADAIEDALIDADYETAGAEPA